ncbi:MAG: YlxR family protein [Nodosilinea sp.]
MPPNYRRCISCRRLAPRSEFFRVVRTYPGSTIELNQGMGRSAYICRQAECLRLAQKKNRLARSLKAIAPVGLFDHLWQQLGATDPQPDSIPVESESDSLADQDCKNSLKLG